MNAILSIVYRLQLIKTNLHGSIEKNELSLSNFQYMLQIQHIQQRQSQDMKRIGSIYSRDTSKSKEKVMKLPLKDIDLNVNKNDNKQQRQNKRWKLQLDNVQDSQQKRNFKELPKPVFDSDRKQITFSEAKHEEKPSMKKDDEDVVKKLACLTKIINEIGSLKACGLKSTQEGKLMEIQDKLLEYQRKLLQNEKLNYL